MSTSVQFRSVTQSCATLCDPMNRSTPGLPVHHKLLEFTQIHAHRVGDDIQPSHPLSSPSPPAPNPSQHQGLFNESALLMRWPNYWSFSFSISPSNEHPHFPPSHCRLLFPGSVMSGLCQRHQAALCCPTSRRDLPSSRPVSRERSLFYEGVVSVSRPPQSPSVSFLGAAPPSPFTRPPPLPALLLWKCRTASGLTLSPHSLPGWACHPTDPLLLNQYLRERDKCW